MKIAIITDGNNQLGMGHIYQSMTLVNFLSKKIKNNAEIFFITKSSENVIELLKKTGHPVYRYDNDDLIFNVLKKEQTDRIIFDKLDVSPDLARKIKKTLNAKLIIFTNLTDANQYADITILADIGSDFKNIYIKNEFTGKIEFLGPKYWILRPEFYEYKKKKKKVHGGAIQKIMLIFGGADPSDFSSTVLNVLLQMNSTFSILLVVGAAFEHTENLNAVLGRNKSSKSNVKILKNITNVAKVMYNNDVVFASPGLSFFEALAVGTPVLGFHQNKLQKDVYSGFLKTIDKTELMKLPSIIKNKSFTFPDAPFISSMEIGQGKDDIINGILN